MTCHDFLIQENFLSLGVCRGLTKVYQGHPELYERGFEHAFWNDRTLEAAKVATVDPAAADFMRIAAGMAIDRVRVFYDHAAPLYPDTLNLVGWPAPHPGMPLHADNAYTNGEPHSLAHRAYGCMVYLTDDYEGGELFVQRPDGNSEVVLKPSAGALVSLPAGLSHQHGVHPVTTGLRCVLTFFLTADPAKIPHDLQAFRP